MSNKLFPITKKHGMLPVIGPLILLISLLGCQGNLLYFPDKKIRATPDAIGTPYENVFFHTKDSLRLNGWWVPGKGKKPVILFCHGNGGNISYRLGTIKLYNRMGLSIFLFDYRGYGLSQGSPDEAGTYKDAEAAWRYLIDNKKVSQKEIIIHGRSLGGSIASWLAMKHQPALLIVESSFATLGEVAREHYGSFLPSLILSYRYTTVDYVKQVRCPVLVIHSTDDEIIPYSHGLRIFRYIPGHKSFLTLSGSHNNGKDDSQDLYQRGISEIINNYYDRKQ